MVVCVRTQGGRVDPDLEINKDRLQQQLFFRPVAMLMEPDRPAAPTPNRSSHHSYRPPPWCSFHALCPRCAICGKSFARTLRDETTNRKSRSVHGLVPSKPKLRARTDHPECIYLGLR